MLRSIFAGLLVAMAVFAAPARAEPTPVVVELFTSQGCSSCPPADAFLARLTERDEVIPLALHVDYWDYIGWVDHFADPKFTRRQKAYARETHSRTVYTPQMVVQGAVHVAGYRPEQVIAAIDSHSAMPPPVLLDVSREGGRVSIRVASAGAPTGEAQLQIVRYKPKETVHIGRGENAGRTIPYTNIVTAWETIATWDGTSDWTGTVEAEGEEPVVIILQETGPGAVLAAKHLR